jgi:hypothetical protein
MKSVRVRTLLLLLTSCSLLACVCASPSFGDAGLSSQLLDVSHQWSDLQNQIANAQAHGQQFKPGQLSSNALCGYGAASEPFASVGDNGPYVLPAGSDASAWTLEHASISSDHDTLTVAQSSVVLPGNGRATTAPICVGAGNPSFRLMIKNNGSPNSDLKITVLYENPDGSVHNLDVAKLAAGSAWQPSISIPLGISALAPSYPGGTAVIELQFQPEGLGGSDTWSIDGLYVSQSAPSPGANGSTTTSVDPTTSPNQGPITDPTQLIDISHQVADLQKKVADLQAKGQVARLGKLSLAVDCGYQDPTPVFALWGDPAGYALAPEGDLADTHGWTFHNASIGTGHDPWSPGTTSVSFTKGDSQAVTPAMCVNLANPTIRMFVRDSGGNGKADIKVSVIYEDTDGNTQHLDLARIRATSTWSPSITIPIGVNVLSTASASGVTAVAFQFTVEGLQNGETLSLDDLYLDPFCSH